MLQGEGHKVSGKRSRERFHSFWTTGAGFDAGVGDVDGV